MVNLDVIMQAEAKDRFEKMIAKYMKKKNKSRSMILGRILDALGKNRRQTLIDIGLHPDDVEAYLKEIEQGS